jgi:hypothetical protein
MLREMENVCAIAEHGRTGSAGIKPSLVDFTDVSDEIGFNAPRMSEKSRQTMKELVIGNG